jgi:hypothetical protein
MSPEAIAARQYGLITLWQALAAGLSVGQIKHRCRTGRWRVLRPGVYVVVGTPPSWQQAVLAAVFASGPTAVGSHGTAARLDALGVGDIDAIEVPRGRARSGSTAWSAIGASTSSTATERSEGRSRARRRPGRSSISAVGSTSGSSAEPSTRRCAVDC